MSDGKVTIDIELDAAEAKSQADKEGKQVGEQFADGVDKGAEPLEKDLPEKVRQSTKKAKEPAGDGGKKAGEEFGEKFTDAAKSSLGGLGAKIAGVIGVGAAIDGAFASVEVANEYNEDMGKLSTAFTSVGRSAEEGQAAYRDFVGILGETDQSVEAVNHLAELTNNSEELAEWGTIAAGVYAKFGDSLPIEGLTEAANETAKVGQVTGPLADALNWVNKSEEEFNAELSKMATEEERAAYITKTLSELYEEAGNTYLETNDALVEYRKGQADLNAAMAGIGETLMPVVSAVTGMAAAFLTQLQPAVQWAVDNMPAFIDTLGDISPILFGAAAGAIAFAIALNFSTIVTTLTGALTAAKTAIAAVNAVLMANPIAIVIGLITALVAAFVTAYTTSDEFREKVNAAFSAVKETVSNVISAVAAKVAEIKDTFMSTVSEMVETLKTIPGQMLQIGKDIIGGLIDGIVSKASDLANAAINAVKGAVDGAKTFLGIHSPSRRMRDEIGKPMAEGVAVGFERYNPFNQISQTLRTGTASLSLAAAGNTYNTTTQTVNFNQPMQSAAQVARAMRLNQTYGLAGAR
ncbi:MAG: hypothetical protein IJW29_02215 [Clostridia bacterium]|nr:hypothetical protein [Clostridia bacterium]